MEATLSVLQEELALIDSELQAVEIQVQELLERQQELLQKKTVLKRKIERFSDAGSGSSKDTEVAAEAWNKEDHPWSKKIRDVLRSNFKLKKFRSLQLETINVTMAGKDVFLVMPTGGGKSLCYQLPAVCSDGFTLVICPLISLMEDQLMMLEQLEITAALLNASSSKEHVKWVHTEMLAGKSQLKLIYVTPEKIAKSKMFMSKLEKAYQAGRLTRIAVDEVHCCSQWGHDFRPDYKLLGILKRQFPNAPLIGLTATATNHVLQDAQKILCVQKCITFTASFNRPNLYYEVRQKPSTAQNFIEEIVKLINGRYKGLSGIIYCFSQKDAEQVTMNLQKLGIKAGTYHANMEPKDKSKVHKKWSANEIQVVVATVAFGMGIDKPDVRFVIHHSMSKSMENYYQESGRAAFEKTDVTDHCRDLVKILKQVDKMKEKFTPLKLIDTWLGKGLSKLGVDIVSPKLPRDALERIVAHLILQQYLKEDFSFTAFATISYVKIGPRAELLKNTAHVITIQAIPSKNSIAKVRFSCVLAFSMEYLKLCRYMIHCSYSDAYGPSLSES
ncbi:hypothetical protein lerEdw1_000534 [Lerista edwardsae]|nr:hypothetical protein lerEdw1_000534 [Lerista edwardsae]